MGIPRLITYLRPFSVSGDLIGQSIVIDGPALAYHIWYLCLNSRSQFPNPFEASPSYKLLGETAVKWLDELASANLYVAKIYFDGYLPASKFTTRSKRLLLCTKQLDGYYQSWPQNIPTMSPAGPSSHPEVNLFGRGDIPPHLSQLPAPPFLVPAVIESLLASERYRNLVQVVPGEADQFCADYVWMNSGIVLTGDSDLLIYDLGPQGVVTFFKDLNLMESNTRELLECVQYKPEAIAERLNLPKPHGLRSLAFEMVMDPYGRFRSLLQKATSLNAITNHSLEYQEFSNLYSPLTPDMRLLSAQSSDAIENHLHLRQYFWTLDPRISELILQFPTFARITGFSKFHLSSDDFKGTINIFLPFLLDYPLRTSAWEIGVSVRQLAYGLLNLIVSENDKISMVVEHRRQQNSKGRPIPNDKDVLEACVSILHMFDEIHICMPELSKNDFWRTVAVYQDFLQASNGSNSVLSNSLMGASGNSREVPFRLTWKGIHLFSQLEASFYSFRILKQVLELVLLYSIPGELPSVVYELQNKLGTLPYLNELPSIVESLSRFGNQEDLVIIEGVRKILNVKPIEAAEATSKEGKAKCNMKGPSKDSQSLGKRPKNIFELLSTQSTG